MHEERERVRAATHKAQPRPSLDGRLIGIVVGHRVPRCSRTLHAKAAVRSSVASKRRWIQVCARAAATQRALHSPEASKSRRAWRARPAAFADRPYLPLHLDSDGAERVLLHVPPVVPPR